MQLLVDTFQFRPIGVPTLTETADGSKVYRRAGVFQNHKKKNYNGRIYPESIWKGLFSEGSRFSNRLKSRAVLGLLEHPKDGQTRLDAGPALLVTGARIASPEEIRESIKRGDAIPLEEGDIVGEFEALASLKGRTPPLALYIVGGDGIAAFRDHRCELEELARQRGLDSIHFLGWRPDVYSDRKSTRLNSSHIPLSRMPSSA